MRGMKRRLRAIGRSTAVGVLTAVCLIAVFAGRGIARLLGRPVRPWIAPAYRLWARGLCRIFGMRTTVHGVPPEPPFLLVTNHLGYVDIPLLAAQRDCTFVAKSEIAGWPGAGTVCRAVDTIFVDRQNRRDLLRVGEKIAAALDEGRGVVLFAEATTSAGDTILPFKPSLLAPAAMRRLPVHYATISYRTTPGEPAASQDVCWVGDEAFGSHFQRLIRLSGFEARVEFGGEPISDPDRKELARRLREAMLERFVPMT